MALLTCVGITAALASQGYIMDLSPEYNSLALDNQMALPCVHPQVPDKIVIKCATGVQNLRAPPELYIDGGACPLSNTCLILPLAAKDRGLHINAHQWPELTLSPPPVGTVANIKCVGGKSVHAQCVASSAANGFGGKAEFGRWDFSDVSACRVADIVIGENDDQSKQVVGMSLLDNIPWRFVIYGIAALIILLLLVFGCKACRNRKSGGRVLKPPPPPPAARIPPPPPPPSAIPQQLSPPLALSEDPEVISPSCVVDIQSELAHRLTGLKPGACVRPAFRTKHTDHRQLEMKQAPPSGPRQPAVNQHPPSGPRQPAVKPNPPPGPRQSAVKQYPQFGPRQFAMKQHTPPGPRQPVVKPNPPPGPRQSYVMPHPPPGPRQSDVMHHPPPGPRQSDVMHHPPTGPRQSDVKPHPPTGPRNIQSEFVSRPKRRVRRPKRRPDLSGIEVCDDVSLDACIVSQPTPSLDACIVSQPTPSLDACTVSQRIQSIDACTVSQPTSSLDACTVSQPMTSLDACTVSQPMRTKSNEINI